MVSKKSSKAVSRISSAASPAVSSQTPSKQQSGILRSAFSPSEFQLALFASVIQGLESQHLRVHDVNTSRLRCDYPIRSRAAINSLDWGYYGWSSSESHLNKKKRKRVEEVNGVDGAELGRDAVIAIATSGSEIQMFSPAENKVLGVLKGAHEKGVKDFKFTRGISEGWSIGGDGTIVQWDLVKSRSIRTIQLPSQPLSALARPILLRSRVICASQTPYVVDTTESPEAVVHLNSHRNPIHSLIESTASYRGTDYFLAADSDRYINVFNITGQKLAGNLIAEDAVQKIVANGMESGSDMVFEIIATVNDNGAVEIFSNPFRHFSEEAVSTSSSLKAQRKKMTKRADASIRVIRPDSSGTLVSVFDISFQGTELVLARAEGGVNIDFERVRWRDDASGELILKGIKEIVRGKSSAGGVVMNGVKDMGQIHVDEGHTVVVQGGADDDIPMEDVDHDVISISSGVAEEDSVDSETEEVQANEHGLPEPGSPSGKSVSMAGTGEEDSQSGEPSFGELLRAQTSSEPIDVTAALPTSEPLALVPGGNDTLLIPQGVSLSTVLSQALKTNDTNLLESCFHTTDADIIRTTIQRLEPVLSSTLLQRLAERLHSRPGRYGNLLVWVQWTCVSHGGFIAGNRDVLRKVSSLFHVLDQRCASLDSLLLLKGKLDMLEAQMSLRRQIRESGRDLAQSDDEEGIIYVEGQEEPSNSEDEEGGDGAPRSKTKVKKEIYDTDEESDDEDMPLTVNGVIADSNEEDSNAEEDEEESEGDADLIDDEVEETDNDSSEDDASPGKEESEDDDSDDEIIVFDEGVSEDDEDEETEIPVKKENKKPAPKKSGPGKSFVR